eukprot:3434897-Pyramimonas_sp.AAC.1
MGDWNFAIEEEGGHAGDRSGTSAGDAGHSRRFRRLLPRATELIQSQIEPGRQEGGEGEGCRDCGSVRLHLHHTTCCPDP